MKCLVWSGLVPKPKKGYRRARKSKIKCSKGDPWYDSFHTWKTLCLGASLHKGKEKRNIKEIYNMICGWRSSLFNVSSNNAAQGASNENRN